MIENTYYDKVEFYEASENISFAEVCTNELGFCEGIITDGKSENLIVGIFKKFEYFDLYEIKENGDIIRYKSKKSLLEYIGVATNKDGSIIKDIHSKVTGLDVDPRDYIYDNPRDLFLERLSEFKGVIFSDKNMLETYNFIKENLNTDIFEHTGIKK